MDLRRPQGGGLVTHRTVGHHLRARRRVALRRRATSPGVGWHRGARSLAAHHARQSEIAHEAGNAVSAHRHALSVQLAPHLLHAVDAEVVSVDPADLRLQLFVTPLARRRRSGPGRVVRGRGDLQQRADRLDPPPPAVLLDDMVSILPRNGASIKPRAIQFGGGRGIRTPEGLRPSGFQDRHLQPLGHPSGIPPTYDTGGKGEAIRSRPCMYGTSASGISTPPSCCW